MSKNNNNQKSQARDYAFKFLYRLHIPELQEIKEKLIEGESSDPIFDEELKIFHSTFNEADAEHPFDTLDSFHQVMANKLIKGCFSNYKNLIESIGKLLPKNNFPTIDKVDQSILILGAYEIKNSLDTPVSVIINEYVLIAKKYAAKNTYSFVNGVLDSYSKNERK